MPAVRLLLAALATIVLAACEGQAPFQPATTRSLAREAEELAAALEAGRPCEAASLAEKLQASAERAVADGAVPAEVGPDLVRVIRRLRDATDCPTPTPSPTPASGDQEDEDGEAETDSDEGAGGGDAEGSEEEDDRPGGGPPDDVPPDVPPGLRGRGR